MAHTTQIYSDDLTVENSQAVIDDIDVMLGGTYIPTSMN
jgi:hypothetical protein